MLVIDTIEKLEALYGTPGQAALVKVARRITPHYRRLIDASPFVALASCGPEGLDCSPRGDPARALHILDETTVLMPDRRGNNRIDTLRNIVRDPRVALLCLIPGSATTVRINGEAHLSAEPDLLERFAIDGKAPRSVIVIQVGEIYFQCARAVHRAGLWDPDRFADPAQLPSPGELLEAMSAGEIEAAGYDAEWPERARRTMW